MDNAVSIEASCKICGKMVKVTMAKSGYERWLAGEHIQKALSELSAGEREFLISGVCEPCFDSLGDDDE